MSTLPTSRPRCKALLHLRLSLAPGVPGALLHSSSHRSPMVRAMVCSIMARGGLRRGTHWMWRRAATRRSVSRRNLTYSASATFSPASAGQRETLIAVLRRLAGGVR